MGIHVPCDGIMAVERCVGCFVILACSRDVWEKFSSGTSLGRRGWVVGIHVPCDGIMAVELCVGCFVILACSRDVWEKFSSGTSLNKQCLSAYSK